MHPLLRAVRDRPLSGGTPIRGGASEGEIRDFEERYHVRLPESVRELYRCMDGMDDLDEEGFRLWPLEEVGTVPEKVSPYRGIPDYGAIESSLPEAKSYFAFADFLCWSHVWAVRLTDDPEQPDPVICISSGDCWCEAAPSFAEFLRKYVEEGWTSLI